MSRFTRLCDRVDKIHDSTHVLIKTEYESPAMLDGNPARGVVINWERYSVVTILRMLLDELGYEVEGIPRQMSSIKLVKKEEE